MKALAIFFAIVSILKVSHFIYEIFWLICKGGAFATKVEHALSSKNESLLKALINENRQETHIIIYFITKHLGNKGYLIANYLYRMPSLLFIICILGYFSERNIVIYFGIVTFICTSIQVVYLVASRIILGVADNYYHPVTYSSAKEDSYYATSWGKRQVLHSFLTRFVIIFMSTVFSMGFVHYAIDNSFLGNNYHFAINEAIPNIVKFTYFSVLVITTTGFGDMYPTSIPSMVITTAEIIYGLLFIVVLLFSVSLTIDKS